MRRSVAGWMTIGVLALACGDSESPVAATDGTSGGTDQPTTTSASTTGSMSSSGPDGTSTTAEPSTSDDPTSATTETTDNPETTDTTGGCMPGVFGESRFGEACFQ